jgi:hypothetical protein
MNNYMNENQKLRDELEKMKAIMHARDTQKVKKDSLDFPP